jgi:SAM-dependent methyltransferase
MTTLPPERFDLHEHRQAAESFGNQAERYDRTRPDYPQELIDRILDRRQGVDVVCAGCGTGIDARQFAAAGCRVTGVEVDERMARFARSTGLEVEVGAFENWDPRGRKFDVVAAGQAWHWIDPVKGAQTAAELLRPGGVLAVYWNVHHLPAAIAEAQGEAFLRVMPDCPFSRPIAQAASTGGGYSVFCDNASAGIRSTGKFGEPQLWRLESERRYSKAQWLDQMPTHGSLTQAPAAQLNAVLESVGDAIDAAGGSLTVRYSTLAVMAEKG